MTLRAWILKPNQKAPIMLEGAAAIIALNYAVWIDLINPTSDEISIVEQSFHLELPTRDEMEEIETSSRLYKENDTVYLTSTMIGKADTDAPEITTVAFIADPKALITLRYLDLHPFRTFCHFLEKHADLSLSPPGVLAGLLEAIVDRFSDILEITSARIEVLNRQLFIPDAIAAETKNAGSVALMNIGTVHSVAAKVRESLVSIGRLLAFAEQELPESYRLEINGRLAVFARDINALSDQASFISGNITFLLDATLGLINIEQNAIIKIFSVATMIFLPPTLIASIYGMNFKYLPELQFEYGYPLALLLMVLSAFVPYRFFRKKGWL
jgi:magnesium transporter